MALRRHANPANPSPPCAYEKARMDEHLLYHTRFPTEGLTQDQDAPGQILAAAPFPPYATATRATSSKAGRIDGFGSVNRHTNSAAGVPSCCGRADKFVQSPDLGDVVGGAPASISAAHGCSFAHGILAGRLAFLSALSSIARSIAVVNPPHTSAITQPRLKRSPAADPNRSGGAYKPLPPRRPEPGAESRERNGLVKP